MALDRAGRDDASSANEKVKAFRYAQVSKVRLYAQRCSCRDEAQPSHAAPLRARALPSFAGGNCQGTVLVKMAGGANRPGQVDDRGPGESAWEGGAIQGKF